MKTSEKLDKLLPLFIKVKANLKQPKKDRQGYGYKYADLNGVQAAIDSAIAQSGASLNYTQDEGTDDQGMPVVTTRVFDDSGQYIESSPLVMPVAKHDAQGMGSAYTYGRRYQLSAMFGIASEDDDDAYASQRNQMPQRQQRPAQRRQPAKRTAPRRQVQPTQPQASLTTLKAQYNRGFKKYQELSGDSSADAQKRLQEATRANYGDKLKSANEVQRYEAWVKCLALMVKNAERNQPKEEPVNVE